MLWFLSVRMLGDNEDGPSASTVPSAGAASASTSALVTAKATSLRELEETTQKLQKQLAELEEVEKQVAKKLQQSASGGSIASASSNMSSTGSDNAQKSPSMVAKKDSAFAQLQSQWKHIAEASSGHNAAPGLAKKSSGSLPLQKSHMHDAALIDAVRDLIRASTSESSKRLIILFGSNDAPQKDLIVVGPEVKTLAELKAVIEKEVANGGKKVKEVTFESVPLQDKHVKALHDKDQLRVTFA
jgi:hypothetical protein